MNLMLSPSNWISLLLHVFRSAAARRLPSKRHRRSGALALGRNPFWYSACGSGLACLRQEDSLFLRELLETGKVVPVIDRSYPLAEVPEAIRYLEAGHARGKVVLT